LAIIDTQGIFNKGVLVDSLEVNSSEFESGLRAGEIIQKINDFEITNVEDYIDADGKIFVDNETRRIDITTNKGAYTFFIEKSPQITVEELHNTRIKTGLDLRGGARALVQPDKEISDSELQDLIQISQNRFNVYGLSDVQIKGVSDLDGNKFMLIEVAGSKPSELQELISQQGVFEGKIGNETAFRGGERDISDVCRNDAKCAAVTRCDVVQTGHACSFQFTIYLTEEAAKRHADVTKRLFLDKTNPEYLSEKLDLYVDGKVMSSLFISKNLKGQVATEISIQGSGVGRNQDEAITAAKEEMNKLQTILITGSLPYKLNIVKLDSISPTLGKEFVRIILIAGFVSLIAVSIVIFVRYRKIKTSVALLFTSFSELILILGFAALIKWNIDLPSIAGILATIGTGVDSQIVILDETRKNDGGSIKDRIKRSFFIIMSSYATALASLIPLGWAGAGLFKGFAITTIVGITVGVFLSRPAFADMIRKMEE
jgi:preprotein translocase subunit SecD